MGTNSDIYHKYSRALHTVAIKPDEENNDFKVSLVFELEAPALKERYLVGNHEKYLLDEIYDRTQKMELERRYCMKFMYPYINIGRIQVVINIYGAQSQLIRPISYTLLNRCLTIKQYKLVMHLLLYITKKITPSLERTAISMSSNG